MIAELDTVVLARDIDAHGLKRGDIGAVVHRYTGGTAFEVEFVTGEGETVAVLTLSADDIRPIGRQEILHVRELVPARPRVPSRSAPSGRCPTSPRLPRRPLRPERPRHDRLALPLDRVH